MQPIRNLGEYTAHVRLTMDLVPEIKIIVYREGEAVEGLPQAAQAKPATEVVAEETPASETEESAAETAS
jgi:large subunit ribosomal protein L9